LDIGLIRGPAKFWATGVEGREVQEPLRFTIHQPIFTNRYRPMERTALTSCLISCWTHQQLTKLERQKSPTESHHEEIHATEFLEQHR
jgi:hypothetical protein